MFFLAVNIIKKNCVIGKQGFSLFPFFVLGIVPIFANDNYTLTTARCYQHQTASIDFSYQDLPERYNSLDTWIISSPERSGKGRIFYTQYPYNLYEEMM